MTETQKKLQELKINKRAEALRNNLRKRKIQQQARQEIIKESHQFIEDLSTDSLIDEKIQESKCFL